MLTSAKLMGFSYYKVYFMKLLMCVYVHAKFQVSRTILTSVRVVVVVKQIKQIPKKPT